MKQALEYPLATDQFAQDFALALNNVWINWLPPQSLSRLEELVSLGKQVADYSQSDDGGLTREEILATLNQKLERYVLKLKFFLPGLKSRHFRHDRARHLDHPVDSDQTHPLAAELEEQALYDECALLWIFGELLSSGKILRIKKCPECKGWFFGRTIRQRFCQTGALDCQSKYEQEHRRKAEPYRSWARNYQKMYYRKFQSPNSREWKQYYKWLDTQHGIHPEARSLKEARQQMSAKVRKADGKKR